VKKKAKTASAARGNSKAPPAAEAKATAAAIKWGRQKPAAGAGTKAAGAKAGAKAGAEAGAKAGAKSVSRAAGAGRARAACAKGAGAGTKSKAAAAAAVDGATLVGRKVIKAFDGVMYAGRVTSFDPKAGRCMLTRRNPR